MWFPPIDPPKQKYGRSMAQGSKAEQRILDLFFIPWLLLFTDFFHGSGFAAADKRGEPQEVGCAPLLRFSPFEIPFPYLPPGFAPRGWVLSNLCFLSNARTFGVVMRFRTFALSHLLSCSRIEASFVKLLTIPTLSH